METISEKDAKKIVSKGEASAIHGFIYDELVLAGNDNPTLEDVLEKMLADLRLAGLYKRNPRDRSTVCKIHYTFK